MPTFARTIPVALIPSPALANTGPLPLSLLFVVISMAVIPGIALFLLYRLVAAWRKLSGVICVAGGALGLWAYLNFFGFAFSNWPLIYVSLVPLFVVWRASLKAVENPKR